MGSFRVLVIDEVHEVACSGLAALGFSVDYVPDVSSKAVLGLIGGYDGLVLRSKVLVDSALLASADRLRFVARAGAGLEHIDQSALAARGVALLATPQGSSTTLAEHCLGMLLALLHHIVPANRSAKLGDWERAVFTGTELADQTVGVLGYGHMGQAFGSCLAGLGCRVIAYDRADKVAVGGVELVDLPTFFQQTTVLSVHISADVDNHHYVSAGFLGNFKHPLYVLNTARGEVLEAAALLPLLAGGRILGVGLDVFESEPFSGMSSEERAVFAALAGQPNVIFTPHIAGWSTQSYERIGRLLVEEIKKWHMSYCAE